MENQTKPLEILVVEDIPENRDAAKTFFDTKKGEISVDYAPDYNKAIQKLEEKKYNAVISDLCMPEETGTKNTGALFPFLDEVLTYWKVHIKRQESQEKGRPNPIIKHLEGELVKPIEEMKAGSVDEIPYGALIVKYCSSKAIPVMIASNAHEGKTYPVVQYLRDTEKEKKLRFREVGSINAEGFKVLMKDEIGYWKGAYQTLLDYLRKK